MDEKQTVETPPIISNKDKPEQATTPSAVTQPQPVSTNGETTSAAAVDQQVQASKPIYDGYILSPSACDHMLLDKSTTAPARGDEPLTSAYAHYRATEHLRQQQHPQQQQSIDESSSKRADHHRRRDVTTMTNGDESGGGDGGGGARSEALPPGLLFKVGFEAKRRDREQRRHTAAATSADVNLDKDFVNVVDLKADEVKDLLDLIEHHHQKQQQQQQSVKKEKKKRVQIIAQESKHEEVEEEIHEEKDEVTTSAMEKKTNDKKKEEEHQKHSQIETDSGDAQTLLIDRLLKRKMASAAAKSNQEIARDPHVLPSRLSTELKHMDAKIEAMNRMAAAMGDDYSNYDLLPPPQQQQQQQQQAMPTPLVTEKRRQEQTKHKTQTKTPATQKSVSIKTQPQQHQQSTQRRRLVEQEKIVEQVEAAEDEEEAERDKKQSQPKVEVESGDDENDATIRHEGGEDDELVLPLSSTTNNENANESATNLQASIEQQQSHNVAAKPAQTQAKGKYNISGRFEKPAAAITTTPTPTPTGVQKQQMNLTYEKQTAAKPVAVSALTKRNTEMSKRRDARHDQFAAEREQQAERLLQAMLADTVDNLRVPASASTRPHGRATTSVSRSPPTKLASASKTTTTTTKPNKTKPPLAYVRHSTSNLEHDEDEAEDISCLMSPAPSCLMSMMLSSDGLNRSSININTTTHKQPKEQPKPSLMAKTIDDLQRRQRSAERRQLRELEMRASQLTNDSLVSSPSPSLRPRSSHRQLRPFDEMVHVREPHKLRAKAEHAPLTYTQQLKQLTPATATSSSSSTPLNVNEVRKVYGSRRVKGIYQSYVKSGPRRATPYTQRLQSMQQQQQTPPPTASRQRQIERGQQQQQQQTASTSNKRYVPYKKLNVARLPAEAKKMRATRRVNAKAMEMNDMNENEDGDGEVADLSNWSLESEVKRALYGNTKKKHNGNRHNKDHGDDRDDQDTLADTDAHIDMERLLDEERANERLYAAIVDDDDDNDEEDADGQFYVDSVDLEELKNMSLLSSSSSSGQSAASGGRGANSSARFIDWEQIDNLIEKFK